MNNKKTLTYITVSIIIAGIAFFVLEGINYFKPKSIVLSHLRSFSFINQNGNIFTDKNMRNKVCVVSFFSTQCQSTCPLMNNRLLRLYNEYKTDSNFMIASHTWNPKADSVPALKRYADSLHTDSSKWVFLTGPKDSLYLAAHDIYLLTEADIDVDNIDKEFLHTEYVVLVDKNGQIRGQLYDVLKEKDLKKLRTDINTLLKERGEQEDEFVNNVI